MTNIILLDIIFRSSKRFYFSCYDLGITNLIKAIGEFLEGADYRHD
jgi:hypothetical protein